MGCTGAGKLTEYDFVRSMVNREPADCRGPALMLALPAWRLEALEQALETSTIEDLLWEGFLPEYAELTFQLCAAHWMDLSYVSGVRARLYIRADWFSTASTLLRQICAAAQWDPKEIANLMMWQRVQLT